LISVSRNLCIDHYRSVRKERQTIDREVTAEDVSPVSATVSPLAALEHRDLAALLRQALQGLPQSLRMAVLLRDIQELSYQEIAERLRLPEGTVKSRINRGRKELARQIHRLRDEAGGRAADSRLGAPGVAPAGSHRGRARRRATGVPE
jgi:RNA polymerase sigma-70 factor (ECF subfamily)